VDELELVWGYLRTEKMDERNENQIRVTLHKDGVAAPAHQATRLAYEVVATCLTGLAEGDLEKPKLPNVFIQYGFGRPELTSDEHRALYESWLLAKGFQDVVRGVRATLEEAAFYLAMLAWKPSRITRQEFEYGVQRIKKHAAGRPFPKLLEEVNSD
jgi:hypothetical protein